MACVQTEHIAGLHRSFKAHTSWSYEFIGAKAQLRTIFLVSSYPIVV